MIVTLHNENAPIKQIVSFVTSQLGGTKNISLIHKDMSNFASSTMKSLFDIELSTTLDYFKYSKAKDASFFYVIKPDDFGRAQNIFWVDEGLCLAYQYFRDVITFDITYMTNKYNVSFAPFIETNHHWQFILFGCVLIHGEQVSTFEWIFTTWLEPKEGLHPKAMITGQDLDIKEAISKIFSDVLNDIF